MATDLGTDANWMDAPDSLPVRATGIGSAAAVSAGAMALGVAHVLPGKPQEAGPASAVEASASTEPEASSAPSVAPSTVLEVPVASPSLSVDPGNVHQLDAPAGMLYSVQDDATGEVLSALVVGDEPGTGTAVLTSAYGPACGSPRTPALFVLTCPPVPLPAAPTAPGHRP